MERHRLASVLSITLAIGIIAAGILGQEYALYDGNVERAFPLHPALIAPGAAVAVLAASQLVPQPAPLPGDRLRTTVAGIFLLIAVFFALAWIVQVVQVYRGEKPAGYVDGPTLFWLIRMLDFGFLLPALGAIGLGLVAAIMLMHHRQRDDRLVIDTTTFGTGHAG